MTQKRWVFIGFVLLVLVGISSFFFIKLWQPAKSFAYRQVKAVAVASESFQLPISGHIRLTPRPQETFAFPIAIGGTGPVNSLYAGKMQYPFYCMTLDSGLGQPQVDNQLGLGVPVYRSISDKKDIIGYSKDCSLPTSVSYYRVNGEEKVNRVTQAWLEQQASSQKITGSLFRVEQGTINRFIYTLVMPVSLGEVDSRTATSRWNQRLIYQFNGGSGIGYRQGRQTARRVITRQLEQLQAGYAVISSSGNRTSYTYNMLLAEDTARRVKQQFVSLYGEPLYTVGIGGSGGGLAQYLIGQNSRGILDGLIPLYSYPDMITQTTYALDCDLLNNYFTFRSRDKATWNDWQKRQLIEGMNAINDFPQKAGFLQPVNQLMAGFVPSLPQGNSECINGYFGLSSFINNPRQGFIRDFFHPEIVEKVNWSYWQDMANLFGKDEQGFGLTTWDNVGVQYGLSAFVDNNISFEEFLDINKNIGSWKPQPEMEAESLITPFGKKLPLWLSLWGNQNITKVNGHAAKRRAGSLSAMQAAYRSGQVFIGKLALPVIDVRHYLEDDLDMHHVSASFYSRLRMQQANGHADNHVIWISHKEHNPVQQAFNMMDSWLLNKKEDSFAGVLEAKPDRLQDTCFAADGAVLHRGQHVWDGQWNQKSNGSCQQVYPMYSTSRIQAGGGWAGDVFKCQLMPVKQAIKAGLYGQHDMSGHIELLEAVFPDGVCDYQQADLGRPDDI
ncbi:DUF6351 family protein [Thalassomonas haliotis]|uniref:DUF6351 domain-containing protein n=1 Tax=Thalassomonas haliotis TaxID=485448 RepID=A0ABY7VCG5_9GAMM|nr:DUF6351 family protein [Thalassomonas haliotis]WDE11092.1 hypothetical protein H3N35_23105 [Thalassomonas haliotis]